ncbi:MAG: SPOR domain-containing protein [Methylococcales bacterium]|nr:SPOR domain-containing protein [Methylococcales bacterium]
MAKDYKDRGRAPKKRRASKNTEKPGRWILIGSLIVVFVAFLVYLKSKTTTETAVLVKSTETTPAKVDVAAVKKEEKVAPEEPKFDYYTILPNAEIVVPDHEIKSRVREELVGKVKLTQYTVQAGAFRDFKDADHLKTKLLDMGIASTIEKAKVGNVVWSRVKLGPYAQLNSVEQVKARLRKSGIDAMITEVPR